MMLCLDYGERYVGVAITDPEGRLALRHSVIDQKKEGALVLVIDLVAKNNIKKVLVGVPLNLEGEETDQTHVSLAFMEQLRDLLGGDVTVEGVDETLTSVEAEHRLAAEGGKAQDEHAEAARLMLEEYLKQSTELEDQDTELAN